MKHPLQCTIEEASPRAPNNLNMFASATDWVTGLCGHQEYIVKISVWLGWNGQNVTNHTHP
jgi:hypothetical protein